MCGSSNRTFSLPLASHLPQHRRENVRFEEPHVLPSSCMLSPIRNERECATLRAARSSSSRTPSPTTQERECVALRAAHSLLLLRTNLMFSASRALSLSHTFSHTTGERNVRFFEPHISLCLSRTISNKPGERTENICIREFTFHINVIAIK